MSAENESSTANSNSEKRTTSVILLDVAGTITSLNFIKETLFPYAEKHLEEQLKANWEDENVKALVKKLSSENEELTIEKELTYKKGYDDGSLKPHVYSDVPEALAIWTKTKRIAVYSRGTVESQKLFLKHTTEGDLSGHISNYFDLSVGDKQDDASYVKIAEQLSITPEELIYINDEIDEAKAAKKAGATAILIKRDGNVEIPEADSAGFTIISSLIELPTGGESGKRKNEEPETAEAPPPKVAKTENEAENKEKAAVDKKEDNKIELAIEAMEVDAVETGKGEDKKVAETVVESAPSVSESKAEKAPAATEPVVADQDVEMAEESKAPEESPPKSDETVKKTAEKTEEKPKEEKPATAASKEEEVVKTEKDVVDKMEVETKIVENKLADEVKTIDDKKKTDEVKKVEKDETKIEVTAEKTDDTKTEETKENNVPIKEKTESSETNAQKETAEKEAVSMETESSEASAKNQNEDAKNKDVTSQVSTNDTGPKQEKNIEEKKEDGKEIEEKKPEIEAGEKPSKKEKLVDGNEKMEVENKKSEETIIKKDAKGEVSTNDTGTNKEETKVEEMDAINEDKLLESSQDEDIASKKEDEIKNSESQNGVCTKEPSVKIDEKKPEAMEVETKTDEKAATSTESTDKTNDVNTVTATVDVSSNVNTKDDEKEATKDVNKKEDDTKTVDAKTETVTKDVNTEDKMKETTEECVNNLEKTKKITETNKENPAGKPEESRTAEVKSSDAIDGIDGEKMETSAKTENVNGEATTSDAMENQSDLANGTDSNSGANSSSADGVENGDDVKNNGGVNNSTTEEEIKVKKLEEKSDSNTVSVEA
ncbi:hypothetical protein QE152_g33927 [Popillia japonica]|uniref:Enolase-phosphatase E1 n=1 Tax=Popillia japonica TaxID=7064 RepID=A0AAW1IVK9_POPJA